MPQITNFVDGAGHTELIKTLADMRASRLELGKFLSVGDRVDDALYDEMLGCVAPLTHRSKLMQVGEPHSLVYGSETYATFRHDGTSWLYAGYCHAGKDHEPSLDDPECRLFIGIFPGGISYADRAREEHSDYKRLAFLPYRELELKVEDDCPDALRTLIEADAAKIIARRGEDFRISYCGQTVRLGA
jgi:hypothetical protein